MVLSEAHRVAQDKEIDWLVTGKSKGPAELYVTVIVCSANMSDLYPK
jgi:hypothetical protein